MSLLSALVLAPVLTAPLSSGAVSDVGTAEPSGEVIASVRGVTFRASEVSKLSALFPDLLRDPFASVDAARSSLSDAVSRVLQDRVLDQEIQARGLAESEEGRARVTGAERAAGAAWAREVGEGSQFELTEEALRQAYEDRWEHYHRPDELTTQQIFFDMRHLSSEEAVAKRARAREVADQLRQDPDRFSELARRWSESTSQPLDATIILTDPGQIHESLREPLWSTPAGGIIGPLESPVGLHIFKVVRRMKRAYSYEDVAPYLAQQLRNQWITERRNALESEAESRFGLVLHPVPERLLPETVLVSGAETVTGADLGKWGRIDLRYPFHRNALRQLMLDAQREALWLALAREEHWTEDPRYQRALDDSHFPALRALLWEKIAEESEGPLTDEDIRADYDAHSDALRVPVRTLVRELELDPARLATPGQTLMMMDLRERALELRRRWASGEDFADLVRSNSTAPDASAGGVPRWVYPQNEDAADLEALAALATGEVSEPLSVGQHISLFQVQAVGHGVPRSFEEMASQIHDRLWTERMRRVQARWRAALQSEIAWNWPDGVLRSFVAANAPSAEATSR